MFRPPSLEEHLEVGSFFSGNQTNEGGSSGGLRISGFLPQSHPLRREITDVYDVSPGYSNTFPNVSNSAISPLPADYGQTDGLPPARFKILPREEEGREALPPYTCSLHKEAVFERKMELRNPFEPAKKRRWKKCYLVLHGTKLEVHKPKKIPFFSSARKAAADPSKPVGYRPGTLLESYTLQLAEVGTATDYRKRHFAIRLRVQTVQFLISCRTLEVFLEWLEALSAAIDLSPSLEERSDPRYQTLPRRRRRRVNPAPATAGPLTRTTTAQERFGAMRGNLPHDAEGTALGRQTSNQESIHGTADIIEATPTHPRTPAHLRRARTQQSEEEEPPFDADGKWAPRTQITREANLRFARRCMAILARDAPRQSDFVVFNGKRYRLLYERKKMVPDGESEPEEPEQPPSTWWGKRPATAKGKAPEERDKPPLPRLPEYEEVVGGAGIAVVVSAW